VIPEQDDEAIKHVEPVLDVTIETVSEHLEYHLDGEQSGEEQVDVLEDSS